MTPRRIWILVAVALLATGLALAPEPDTPGDVDASLDARTRRLLGPVAPVASDIQWIRFQRAAMAGDLERAIVLAESALALAPFETDSWVALASYLAYDRASINVEPDPELRRIWFEAGVATARRGAVVVPHPEALYFWLGLLYILKANQDPDLHPNGVDGLLEEAALAFEDAARAGHEQGAEFATYARDRDRALSVSLEDDPRSDD